MKVIVKAKYITYAMVEVDARDADEANMKLDTLAKWDIQEKLMLETE